MYPCLLGAVVPEVLDVEVGEPTVGSVALCTYDGVERGEGSKGREGRARYLRPCLGVHNFGGLETRADGMPWRGVRWPDHDAVMSSYGAGTLPTRVFISFDFDEDRGVARLLGGQLRRSPRFHIENWSMKEAAPEKLWPEKARARINRSDVVLVVVGSHTYRAPGVLLEVEMARLARPPVPLRQVIGYRNLSPRRVAEAGRTYRWGHDQLEQVLNVPRRRAA